MPGCRSPRRPSPASSRPGGQGRPARSHVGWFGDTIKDRRPEVRHRRKTKRYPGDLTDEDWSRIQPLLPKPSKRGRKISVSDIKPALLAARSTARPSKRRTPRSGYGANKKIVGRKRYIAVDTDGRLPMVNLATADISDSAGAQGVDNEAALAHLLIEQS